MSTPLRFVALVPARMASSRLPDKPLALIGGIPMVIRVARQALASGATQVAIATDSQQVVDAARSYGIDALMTRPDHASGTDRLAEAVAQLALDPDEIVVNVQGDEPLIPPELIAQVAALLATQPDCPMATAAHPIDSVEDFLSPHVVKVVTDRMHRALYFSRAPIPFERDAMSGFPKNLPESLPAVGHVLRHIGLYAYRAAFLSDYQQLGASPLESIEALEQLRVLWHGHRIAVLTVPHAPPAGIDTPADLERVRQAVESFETLNGPH